MDVTKVVVAHFSQQPSERLQKQLSDALELTQLPFDELPPGPEPCLILFDKQDRDEMRRARRLRERQPGRTLIWLLPRLTIPDLRQALSLRIAQVFPSPLPPTDTVELKLLLNSRFYAPGHALRPTHEKLRCVLDTIERRFEQPLSLQQLAHEAGISDSRLCHLFSQQLGLKFSLYLICRRLEAAPEALRDDGMNIAAVAYKLGFSTPSHFCRAFKTHYGVTPSEYKQGSDNGKHSHAFHRYLQCRRPERLAEDS